MSAEMSVEMNVEIRGRQRFTIPYMWLIITTGAAASIYAAAHLTFASLDLRFLLLALIMETTTSHAVDISSTNSGIRHSHRNHRSQSLTTPLTNRVTATGIQTDSPTPS